jgi:integrase
MARLVNRLNPLKIKSLNESGLHADGNGLYLSVSPTGSKSYRLIYKWQGRRTELGLGPAGPVSLADARAKADEAARLRAQGIDPKQHWRATPVAVADNTFGAIAIEFISDRKAGWKNAKHRQQWENTLKTYAKPIWEKSVADVSVDDALVILRPIWSSKPETAQRVRGRIEAVLDAAKVRGLRSGENPATWRGNLALVLSKPRKGPKKHHAAMSHEDVPAFMVKLAKANGLAARALELLVHTAARTSEVLDATWAELDLKQGIWTVPAERMKAGKEHRVPLTAYALALLANLPRRGHHLFPGARKDKSLSNMSMAMVLRRMGLDQVTVHGFRSSFRDWAADVAEAPREIAEQALAHQVGSDVERAYRRGDALEQRRALMTEWSNYITKGE